jgi:hypothetical protein
MILSQEQWLIPVILTTLEAKIRKISVPASPGRSSKDPISTNKKCWWWQAPVIPAMWETEIGGTRAGRPGSSGREPA